MSPAKSPARPIQPSLVMKRNAIIAWMMVKSAIQYIVPGDIVEYRDGPRSLHGHLPHQSGHLRPPVGTRSFGPLRAALYGGRGYATEANDQIACIAMIETREGIENLESIVTTPGLDAIYVGPSDLALALGLPARGDTDDPLHLAAVDRILSTCKQHGLPVGIHTNGLAFTQRRIEAGFNFVTLNSDAGFMMRAVYADLAAASATQNKERGTIGS